MESVLEVQDLVTRFGAERIHDGVSFSVRRGEMVALIGGGGTGKTGVLKGGVGLPGPPAAGSIRLLGAELWRSSPDEMNALRRSMRHGARRPREKFPWAPSCFGTAR